MGVAGGMPVFMRVGRLSNRMGLESDLTCLVQEAICGPVIMDPLGRSKRVVDPLQNLGSHFTS